ncbi:DUF4411 family protein [Rugamonas sp.]|uniref:DUF4411 family protein n=1 Tax=Rugamonas sp. TaxID=1926287 RepID=UPI0025FF30AD|nr:DUF4411 family protein [Rugamonas sp.]
MSSAAPALYLLDANVLIDAHNKYYAVDMVPEFWDWLLFQPESGVVAMPLEIYEEVRGGPDAKVDLLHTWISHDAVANALIQNEDVDISLLAAVVDAYAPDLNDNEIEQLGRDPFLIAYGLVDNAVRRVVSNEVSKPGRQRANRKVPDVCRSVSVPCCDTFTMLRQLGFRTGWAR